MSTDRNDIPAVLTDEATRAPTYRVMLQYGALLKRLIFSNDSAVVHLCQLFQPLHTPVTAVGSCLIYPCVSYQQSTKSSEPRCQIFTVFCCCDKSAIPLTSFWLNLKVPAMTAELERSLLMVPLRFALSFRNYLLGECSASLQKGFTDII